MRVLNEDGTRAYFFGETSEGGPRGFSLWSGKSEDVSMDIVGLFIPARLGFKGFLAGTSWAWAKHLERQAAKAAFETALAGGKHAGWLEVCKKLGKRQIAKGIRSFKKEIAEHEAKIANPAKYVKDWSKLDPRQQSHLINRKWPGDIARHRSRWEYSRNSGSENRTRDLEWKTISVRATFMTSVF